MFLPDIMMASTTWLAIFVTIILVPLHIPDAWSRLRISIIGVPIFNVTLWFGKPDVLSEFRNSGVSVSKMSQSLTSLRSIESQLK
jgi:prepilin signal peptidase PulO-like enzyme (type II secretory pathway)